MLAACYCGRTRLHFIISLKKNLFQSMSISVLRALKSHKLIDKVNWRRTCVLVLDSKLMSIIMVARLLV